MQHVDFTAELRDHELAELALRRLGVMHVVTTAYTDTLFRIAHGTLRRRTADDEPNEWLLQTRAESAAPQIVESQSLTDEQARARFGTRRLPVWLTYTVSRQLWMHDTARIHLDRVERLGSFIHIQAMVYPQQPEHACKRLVANIREMLGPALGGPISTDYAVMIQRDAGAA